ncbi:partial Glycogen operon protein GlgX, partial [uncultured bacterium]
GGNNNAWCQNNEISWLNWQNSNTHHEMLRFMRKLIAFRRRHPTLTRSRYLTGRIEPSRNMPDITWHGYQLNEPLWFDNQAQVIAFTLAGCSNDEEDLHIVINMSEHAIDAPLPAIENRRWYLALDTAALPPYDIIGRTEQARVDSESKQINARSIVVFESR